MPDCSSAGPLEESTVQHEGLRTSSMKSGGCSFLHGGNPPEGSRELLKVLWEGTVSGNL